MAYPAFNTGPFVYGVNFHSQDLRSHQYPNRVRFGSTDDASAATIAGLYAGATAGKAQQTSLTKRVGQHNLTIGVQPLGTLFTAKVVCLDDAGAAWTLRIRNFRHGAATSDDVEALMKGTASALCTALASPPALPNSGNPVTVAIPTILDRS